MKKAKGGRSDKKEKDDAANSHPPTDSRIQKKKKRTNSSDLTNMSDDTIKLSFPSNASAQSNFEPLRGEVEKLLFPKDREMFEEFGVRAVGEMGIKAAFQVFPSYNVYSKMAHPMRAKQNNSAA